MTPSYGTPTTYEGSPADQATASYNHRLSVWEQRQHELELARIEASKVAPPSPALTNFLLGCITINLTCIVVVLADKL